MDVGTSYIIKATKDMHIMDIGKKLIRILMCLMILDIEISKQLQIN